jgi:membrane protease YdiL (CAAX protease family)
MKSIFETKTFIWIEMILIFIGIPLLYYYDFIPFHKAIPLLAVFIFLTILLWRSQKFNNKWFWFNGFSNWKIILVRFAVFVVASTAAVLIFSPEFLFFIPRERFVLWVMIMIFYPVWSAFPQELIYRSWFFFRYRRLIKNERLFILVNAALFSFSHIIFENLLAIILTFAGGIMFAYTYRKSKSLMAVSIEHILYGNWIFTVGIGQYFYAPTNF